jgi:hypothetical protein
MTIRTSKKTVTFRRPFVLGGFDEVLPAGAYSVETDEELLEGISFPAYRRILTVIHLHAEPGYPGLTQTFTIDPNELDAALIRDQADRPCSPWLRLQRSRVARMPIKRHSKEQLESRRE